MQIEISYASSDGNEPIIKQVPISLKEGTKVTLYTHSVNETEMTDDGAYVWNYYDIDGIIIVTGDPVKTITADENGNISTDDLDLKYSFLRNSIWNTITAKYANNKADIVELSFENINNDLPSPIPSFDNGIRKKTSYIPDILPSTLSSTATGTKDDPIIINDAGEFGYLINQATDTAGKYYKIADDIENIVLQSNDKIEPIIALSDESAVKTYFESLDKSNFIEWRIGDTTNTFSGHLDGNGVTIYVLYTVNTSYASLFSILGADATIKNLNIKNSYLKTGWYNGVIASTTEKLDNGNVNIAIENCTITNCCLVGKYTADTDTGVKSIPNQCIGLLIGRPGNIDNTHISISNCLVYGNNIHYEYDNSVHNYLIGYSKYL